MAPKNNSLLILFVAAEIKEIVKKGYAYPWSRPAVCPRCKAGPVWGHGFVEAYFDGSPAPLLLRRFRCPHCRCIMRCKPSGFFPRFGIPVKTIRRRIAHRLATGRWPPGLAHTRQGHWLRALKRKTCAYLGNAWSHRLLEAFDCLAAQALTPVSRSI
ncbi:MAG: hypothetical protein JRI47_03955 [Deltaproteobacteria bacterium]|nr:hypothetical protein [Deltaproteobacteria bacterium]